MRLFILLFLAAIVSAAEKSIVTIYQDGYAVVRETRSLTLEAGDNNITIGNLPKNVMGESFQMGGRGLALRQYSFLEPQQVSYSFDQMLIDARGKQIGFRMDSATVVRGTLLQAGENNFLFMKMPDGAIKTFPRSALRDWTFYEPLLKEERKQGEIACVVNCSAAGPKNPEIAYEAAGFQWDARYRLLLNEDSTGIFEGWASVLNRSGKKFDDAELVLVEGNLGRYRNLSLGNQLDENLLATVVSKQAGFKVDGSGGLHKRGGRSDETKYIVDGISTGDGLYNNSTRKVNTHSLNVTEVEILTSGDALTGGYQSALIRVPEEEAKAYVSESHLDVTLYTLPYSAMLKDSAQTEVVLLDPSKVKAYQIYSFWGLDRNQPASVTLQLVNKDQEGLGLALPAAELELFRKSKSGLEQFVGSHRLEKTVAGDTVRVNLGSDPEIQCKSVKLKEDADGRKREIEFEHTLKSTKSDTVAVSCTVRLMGEVTIEKADVEVKTDRPSPNGSLVDLRFTMILPPNEEVKANFAVKVKLPK